ncbi:hypothetical protein PHYSODRAFT_303581 [Phytophthora sojae]|uniref:Uncharacterized protein n=1 Tax=Phytophthora sojae (strain P6497) TaxID=1094619 RepID=G4ZVX4_PHYSP|nr:hypothetical protein PHYSODRAFT_303581 [Phytophthora sojae]EGZ11554.1 hypothetical protein PHYSODRAFT_303581 [Phytophthora sojae]|eukprot:XP_009531887.1 hypothetical protein PHYSODRAFT_303581 [Phytophthora sojae]
MGDTLACSQKTIHDSGFVSAHGMCQAFAPPKRLLLAVNAADAAACKALIDSSSTLTASLAAWTGADPSSVPFASVFEELGAALPSLSKCAAVFDPIAAYVSLAASVKSCLSALESVDSVDEDLTTAAGWANVCPIVEDTVLPCITAAMKESIMGTLFSAGDCCEDFLDEVHTRFGDSLDIMLHQPGAWLRDSFTSEHCPNPKRPNVSAFAGQDFTNTKGELVSLGFGSFGADTMGICLQPLDALTQYIASWPVFSETLNAGGVDFTLADLFTPDTSISGELLLSYLTTSTNLPAIILRVAASLQAIMYADDDAGSAEFVDTFDTDNSGDWNGFNPDSSTNWGSWGWVWSYADNSEGLQSESDDGSAGNWGYADTSESSDSPDIFDELLALAVHVPVNGSCTNADQSIMIPFPIDNA